ncbi:MAG: DinB family protein [Saprospiraceae bacterium]|nr:DinB family protein [Saprospiraceae bacterium]
MTKKEIADLLERNHIDLLSWLESHENTKWENGPQGKWTTGQQALHLLQSMKPLNSAMSMPKFVLKYKFGKANRKVRNFEAVIKRYEERLKEAPQGATFKPSRKMDVPRVRDKSYIMDRLHIENKKLVYKLKKWKDKDLDEFIISHPLMGKMPVREILMWTAHHVDHHTKELQEKY